MSTCEMVEEPLNLIKAVDDYINGSNVEILNRLQFLSYQDRWQVGEVMLYKSEVPEELVGRGERFCILADFLRASFSVRKPNGLCERIEKRETEIMTAGQRMKAQAIAIEPPPRVQEATDPLVGPIDAMTMFSSLVLVIVGSMVAVSPNTAITGIALVVCLLLFSVQFLVVPCGHVAWLIKRCRPTRLQKVTRLAININASLSVVFLCFAIGIIIPPLLHQAT